MELHHWYQCFFLNISPHVIFKNLYLLVCFKSQKTATVTGSRPFISKVCGKGQLYTKPRSHFEPTQPRHVSAELYLMSFSFSFLACLYLILIDLLLPLQLQRAVTDNVGVCVCLSVCVWGLMLQACLSPPV